MSLTAARARVLSFAVFAALLALPTQALAAPTVSEFQFQSGTHPWGIVSGSDGTLWTTENGTKQVVNFGMDSTTFVASSLPPAAGNPTSLALGPDHNLYFTSSGTQSVGVVTAATGAVSMYTSSGTLASGAGIHGITAGWDGNIWFVETAAGKIGQISLAGSFSQVPNSFTLPAGTTPEAITEAPDGDLWYAGILSGHGVFGRVTTGGAAYQLGTLTGTGVNAIALGPDGRVWMTEAGSQQVAASTIPAGYSTGSPTISEYSVAAIGTPADITGAPDGNLWFTDSSLNHVGRISTDGSTVSAFSTNGVTEGIAVGRDGQIWFGEPYLDRVGRITTDNGPATGPAGPTGPAGADGAAGATGAPGATGAQGANGTNGAAGPIGPIGPAGPQGARGAAGRDATVTCSVKAAKAKKGKKAPPSKVTCTVKYATSASVHVALLRDGVVIGRAGGRVRNGSATLHLLVARRALRSGVVVRARLQSTRAPLTVSTPL